MQSVVLGVKLTKMRNVTREASNPVFSVACTTLRGAPHWLPSYFSALPCLLVSLRTSDFPTPGSRPTVSSDAPGEFGRTSKNPALMRGLAIASR